MKTNTPDRCNNGKIGFNLSQAVPISQLVEGHDSELLGGFVGYDFMVAAGTIDAYLHTSPGNEIHE